MEKKPSNGIMGNDDKLLLGAISFCITFSNAFIYIHFTVGVLDFKYICKCKGQFAPASTCVGFDIANPLSSLCETGGVTQSISRGDGRGMLNSQPANKPPDKA